MDNREVVVEYLRKFRKRVDDLIFLFLKKTINLDVLKINLNEDLSDLEDRLVHLISKMEDRQ